MVVGEMIHERELIVIGGGPGGYNAAIRAAQLGLEVTLIENEKLGGVCLNEGCIPSKVFAHAGKKLAETNHLNDIGISFGEPSFELSQLQQWMKKVISDLSGGVKGLLEKNHVEVINGTASFLAKDRIGVEQGESFDMYRFENAIIAVGSQFETPGAIEVDGQNIVDATSIYQIEEVPEQLIVYGSDTNSLEVATSFKTFGANVSIILDNEQSDFVFDSSINRELMRQLKKAKIKLYKESELKTVSVDGDKIDVQLNTKKGTEHLQANVFYTTSKTIPKTIGLGLERANVETDVDGFIPVNSKTQTNNKNIYAIGDVTHGETLAIKAIKQGKIAAETCAGQNAEFDANFMPTIIQTIPPIASVGLTEDEAKDQGYELNIGQIALGGNGYAGIIGEKAGFVKIISDKQTDLLLGFHSIGEGSIELISQGIQSLEMAARDEDITFPFYPHPSLNEGWPEAAEALKGLAVHAPPKKKPATAEK